MKKIFTLENLHLLLGAHIVLWLNAACYGFVGDIVPSSIKLGLVGLWLVICFIRHQKFLASYITAGCLTGIFYLLCYMSQGLDKGYYDQYGMTILYTLILIAVFCYYFHYGTKEEIKVLIVVFLLDVAAVTVRTCLKLREIPELVRIASTSSDTRKLVLGGALPKAIGGYGLCYELVLMQPALSYLLNKLQFKLIFKLLIYGFILFFLFQAQITLAFLLYPIMVLLTYSYGRDDYGSISVTRLILIILSLIVIAMLPTILQTIVETAESHLADRLREVLGFLNQEEVMGDDTQARLELYTISLKSFFNSPIWGAFGQKVYGSHSTLLDILAAYGVVGLTGYFGMLTPIKQTMKHRTGDGSALAVLRLTQWVMIAISIVNVLMVTQIMMVTIVFVPLVIKYFVDEEEANNSEIVSNQCNA